MNFGPLNIQDPNIWAQQQNLLPQGLPMAMPQPQAPQMMQPRPQMLPPIAPRAPMPMMPQPLQQPMQQAPQISAGVANPSPYGQVGDVLNQLVATKQQQDTQGPTMAQRILGMRFEPNQEDNINANVQNNLSLLAPNSFKSTSPQEQAGNRVGLELAPYTTLAKLQESQVNASGGSTGALIDRMMKGDPQRFPTIGDALYFLKGGANQGMESVNGVVNNMQGAVPSKANVKLGEAQGTEVGKVQGEAMANLNMDTARMPQLEATVDKLSALGKIATYTDLGVARDTLLRQSGMKVPDSAIARAQYISLVDNQILPLLRSTFGAQFTQKEGESLKVTLGDPNKSPEEKDAVLRSFIDQKKQTINSLQRQTNQPVTNYGASGSLGGGGLPTFNSPNDPGFAQLPSGSQFMYNGTLKTKR